MKVYITTEKSIFDVNDVLLPEGNYYFDIIRFTNYNSVIGKVISNVINRIYEFKTFSIIKMMAKGQASIARKTRHTYLITNWPSPHKQIIKKKKKRILPPIKLNKTKIYNECSICLEDCTSKTTNYKVKCCKQKFHKKCIKEWYKVKKKRECPLFRAELPFYVNP